MFEKKGSKILKLPPVRNWFTLAMTNKLVVIINSLKVPKIKKILLYEMKFLVPNYSCLQNPWLGGYRPQIPVLSVPCHKLNLLNPPPTKFQGTPLPEPTLNSTERIFFFPADIRKWYPSHTWSLKLLCPLTQGFIQTNFGIYMKAMCVLPSQVTYCSHQWRQKTCNVSLKRGHVGYKVIFTYTVLSSQIR